GGNTDVIKSWVNSSKLVSFAMDSNQYDWSDDDILSSQEYDAGNPNHAQTIVGYDDSKSDDGEQGAYKVVNSWGETWGPNGDGSYWMTYDCLATLEYDVVTSYEGTEYNQTNSNSPELLARWHHTSPGPRDASIELGSGEYSSPKDVRVPSYGKDTSNDYPAFMALDVSEFSDEWNGGRGEERFYLDVRSSSGTSSIDTFKMEFYDNGYTAGSPDMTSDNAYDAPGDSPTTLHLRFKGPGGSDGLAYLDQDKYYIEDTLNVTVEDTDLEGQSSVAVNVTSDTEPSGESLSLSVSSFDDVFTGSIDVSATDSDNVLQVSSGDQITLTYQDSDTGDGSSADKTDQAVVDTTAPSITGGPNVNNKLATLIEWQTNEPSTSRVNYGATKPLGKTSSSSELVSSHSLAVEDLTPGRTYYFEMISTDEAGNTIRDNNSGNYYTFTAGGVDNIEAGDVGWHPDQVRYGSRPWDVRDRKAKSGSYSWNLGNGTYDNALSENLTSPVIDASNWNEKNLTWYHNYSMESGWDGSVVEVNDGSGWTRVTPEGGYDAPLDGSSSYDPDSPLANQDAFTGSSSGWEMETVDLNSFLPTPNLQVRFWFASDAYVGQRGWNIDNVKISGVNMAPSSPTNPSPNNGAIDVSATEVDLSVDVRDPDGDPLDVSFYDSSNTLIGEETGVPSGSTASVTWSGLEEGTEYSWYAEASDGVTSSQSNIWSFTTPQNVQLSSGGESEGWNLISFGLQPQDNSISSLLDNQTDGIVGNYDKAMYFDSGDESWKTYIPDRADHYNDLENWDRSMGIWVHMTENDNLTVKGNIPSPTDITLEPGWNLVGYPSKTSAAADSVLPSQVTEIGTLDPTSPYNINYTTDLSSVTLSPNKGYWVYNSGSTSVTWTVSYS
ncbi:MAG: hypothetical protein KGY76_09175, partial [Candidatus Thermoplasmatota archaeon]|nr:hypothetical protein [Candidatus Thermoplasmatota archaeon]